MGCIQSKTQGEDPSTPATLLPPSSPATLLPSHCVRLDSPPDPGRRRHSYQHFMQRSGNWVIDNRNTSIQNRASEGQLQPAELSRGEDPPALAECEEGRASGCSQVPSLGTVGGIKSAGEDPPALAECEEGRASGCSQVPSVGTVGGIKTAEDDRKKRGISAARILRSYVCELCKQLRNLEPVARALFSAGIIDYEQLQQASSPHTSAAKRVQDILLELYSKVQARPEWMDTICEIFLQESVPYAVDIRDAYMSACGVPRGDSLRRAPVGPSMHVFPQLEPFREVSRPSSRIPLPEEDNLSADQPPLLTADTIVEEFEKAHSEGGLERARALMHRCDPKSDAAKALMMALVQRARELPGCVEMVVAHGIPADFTWQNGYSPIQCACVNGLKDVVQYLQSRPEVNLSISTKNGQGLLHLACEKEHLDVLAILLNGRASAVDLGINVKDVDGRTPLHIVCGAKTAASQSLDGMEKTKEIVELLFRSAVNPELRDNAGNTALHLACLDRCDVVELVLDKLPPGCIDVRNKNGDTCLHIACRHNAQGLVNLLLDAGNANPSLFNRDGYTPLQVGIMEGYKGVVIQILNKHEYTLCAADDHSCSPLHLACMNKHVGIAAEILRRLPWDNSDELTRRNRSGNTPLHIACEVNNGKLVRSLLEVMHRRRLCTPYLVNHKGNTPLHLASEKGNLDIVALLVKHGSEHKDKGEFLDHQNELGNTALHVAAQCGYESIVEFLRKRGASKRVMNKVQKTPADVAYDSQQYEVSKKLGKKGLKSKAARVCGARGGSSSAYSSRSSFSRTSGDTSSLGLPH